MLIDDELLPMTRLKNLLLENELHKIEIVGEFDDPIEAYENIKSLKPDVIFSDIEMPDLNGLELAEKIQEIQPSVEIVFITGFDRYAIDAFNIHAIDYMLKPIQKERLHKTLARLQLLLSDKPIQKSNSTCLQLLGGLKVVSADGQVHSMKWRTTKAKEIFSYILSRHEKTISKDALLELFWSGVDMERSVKQLYTTIYTIRKTLKQYDLHDVQISSLQLDSGYRLQLGNVLVDVDEWTKQLKDLPDLTKDTYKKHEQVFQAYQNHFLKDCDYIWAESERERLKRMWRQHALQLSKFYIKEQMYEQAIEVEKKLQLLDADEELQYFTLMKLYDILNDAQAVEEQYALLKQTLEEQLALEPSEEVKSWFQHWQNNRKQEIEKLNAGL
ncbi:response regulator [Bacillus ndiopicus]|uniref:response regulator n=1 Tax=Bacillus ndiopicus TaxID=1347368 RepID=UPI001E635414|nr:response regulator [Bacillus ndiopicus]